MPKFRVEVRDHEDEFRTYLVHAQDIFRAESIALDEVKDILSVRGEVIKDREEVDELDFDAVLYEDPSRNLDGETTTG